MISQPQWKGKKGVNHRGILNIRVHELEHIE